MGLLATELLISGLIGLVIVFVVRMVVLQAIEDETKGEEKQ